MECHLCSRETKPTAAGKYRRHNTPDSTACDASGTIIPAAPPPGADDYIEALAAAARSYGDARGEVEAIYVQPDPVESATVFSQPDTRRKSEAPAREMTDLGKELTARLKEMFYAFDNRRSSDNRSAQVTMGPSEMGTQCDRRLALSLMRMPPCNPGGDGWAAWVGTCIHAGLEQMFMWADAGSGRFAVEQRLAFDSRFVPKGTADLIDRTLLMVGDHKCQGRWSRGKLKSSGPSQTYRVQAHVYAYGACQRGEKIEHIAIISWPRDQSTLDDLYVHTEPYDPKVALDAFARVERIGEQVEHLIEAPVQERALKAKEFDVDPEGCRYCPFHLPGARSITDGCNGRR